MGILKRIQLKGFKSIKSMDLELRALNVMIGANGSGKSNLISYFKLLNALTNTNGGMGVISPPRRLRGDSHRFSADSVGSPV